VALDGLGREGQQHVDGVAKGPDLVVADAHLIEVVTAADAGHVVLKPVDPQTGARERLGEPRAARLDALASLAADLEAKIVDHWHAVASARPLAPLRAIPGERGGARRRSVVCFASPASLV